ncbi:ABC transporter permease [Streptomyces ipomoeae]|jgi:ABC-2 type transport system permease protein|uniref:Transport permease protein n=2 Tax=Streptomyces ipomoeae TaxID=103232 RepID=L1KMN2_9ACTN|nr:ABC transporter permease [Streptomyces ipomoeae]EKX61847.1 ABC transporter, permease protein, DrrB family [Streptomyces ipomoeae 91-03]MDX2697340.1 ABC transporter permease [Streptomyces ipomoeae]MDX2824838.1 ABC transporter permease [Streptomyces ipomoeae]MDX2843109.1 ABC transporter permease [Streptomyces ipomoeae]MDX2877471.1 ABC transporter permease [Streptomyces ipomoeae]
MSTTTSAAPQSRRAHPFRDNLTMLRRNLLHARRYPSLTLNLLLTPIILLLLFVYVFGDVMSAGITGGPADRADYVAYLVPGILLMTVAMTSMGTAVSVATDMTEGVIARFRTMAISRASVLIGHVIGSVIQTLMALVLVLGIGLAIGFRPGATPVEWIAAAGLLALFSLALTWIAVGIGLVSPNPEGASNIGTPLVMLPFLSSAFVPVDAMPGWFRWFAEYQPFSPAIETLRGLLLGSGIGTTNAVLTVGWCLGLVVLGYLWSKARFSREPRR